MTLIEHLFFSVFLSFSIAVVLVEKGDDWPVSLFLNPIKKILNKINSNIPKVFDCTVCFSFWAALASETIMYFCFDSRFLWPITGFLSLGLTWFVIEFLNALDKSGNQNDKTY